MWLTPVSIHTGPPGRTPDEEKLVSAGVFKEAWKPRWSGCCVVWQMVENDWGAGAGIAD